MGYLSFTMTLLKLKGTFPSTADTYFIAENAFLIGNVTVGTRSSIWYGCNIRGDVNYINIGSYTNIQDCTMIHVSHGEKGHTEIGNYVTVGHQCLLHACTLMDETFVGMGSIIMDGAIMESGSMVAAGSLVTSNKRIKSGELWLGRPAKFVRILTAEEISHIRESAIRYAALAEEYIRDLSNKTTF
ncbi:hexapeptide transferase family protein [Neorickettsia sennetsu str. Miyayama]|uniref:Hexapeptide transferase family protein n=2 Tax=Ehrlichia sennetsu TaxID=951 RepID=Q2GEZ9_EHRS3|nr:hexapeptide transferase family protein [Neorickettsia sennetsu str. Miyayama]